jgi:hypothetical protein
MACCAVLAVLAQWLLRPSSTRLRVRPAWLVAGTVEVVLAFGIAGLLWSPGAGAAASVTGRSAKHVMAGMPGMQSGHDMSHLLTMAVMELLLAGLPLALTGLNRGRLHVTPWLVIPAALSTPAALVATHASSSHHPTLGSAVDLGLFAAGLLTWATVLDPGLPGWTRLGVFVVAQEASGLLGLALLVGTGLSADTRAAGALMMLVDLALVLSVVPRLLASIRLTAASSPPVPVPTFRWQQA